MIDMLTKLNVLKLDGRATIPTKAFPTDAGYDLYAVEDVFLRVNQTTLVKTGIAVNLPEGYVLEIKDRSSMALKGLRTGAGIVDSYYQGDLSVVLHNLNNDVDHDVFGYAGYQIRQGDRIAQFVITKVESPRLYQDSLFPESRRGQSGFGSSGL